MIEEGDPRYRGDDAPTDANDASAAAERDPRNVHALLHAAGECMRAGNAAKAVEYAERAAELAPDNFAAVRTLSSLLDASHRRDDAIRAGHRAVELQPANFEARRHLGGLLAAECRWAEALPHLAIHVEGATPDADSWRLMSTVLAQVGRGDRAIDAIDRAIAMAPARAEFRIHRASLLGTRGRYGDALDELDRAAAIAPGDARIWRAKAGIHEVLGEIQDAIIDAERAVELDPTDEALTTYRNGLIQLLTGFKPRETAAVANTAITTWIARKAKKPRHVRKDHPVTTRLRIVSALILREMQIRYGRSRLGYFWVLVEPITHLLTLGSVFTMLNHSPPPIGDSLFMYYLTGLVPFLMFSHIGADVASSVTANAPVLLVPIIRITDLIAARGLLHLATELVVGILVFFAATFFDEPGMPAHFLTAMAGVGLLWVMGMGCGMINMIIIEFIPSWETFWNMVLRLLYFGSGIYYAAINMPEQVRDILKWNPVLQGLELFRSGFFPDYEPYWLDIPYLCACSFGSFLLGLALVRVLRRHLKLPT